MINDSVYSRGSYWLEDAGDGFVYIVDMNNGLLSRHTYRSKQAAINDINKMIVDWVEDRESE